MGNAYNAATRPDGNSIGLTAPTIKPVGSAYDPGYVTIPGAVVLGPDKLFHPDAIRSAKTGAMQNKYSTGLLIESTDTATLDALTKAIDAKAVAKWPQASRPGSYRSPLVECNRGGNVQDYLDGYYKINASTYRPPVVYRADGTRMSPLDEEELRTGAVARAVVSTYAYEVSGRRGVACRLEALYLTGERVAIGDADNDAATPSAAPSADPALATAQADSDLSFLDL